MFHLTMWKSKSKKVCFCIDIRWSVVSHNTSAVPLTKDMLNTRRLSQVYFRAIPVKYASFEEIVFPLSDDISHLKMVCQCLCITRQRQRHTPTCTQARTPRATTTTSHRQEYTQGRERNYIWENACVKSSVIKKKKKKKKTPPPPPTTKTLSFTRTGLASPVTLPENISFVQQGVQLCTDTQSVVAKL